MRAFVLVSFFATIACGQPATIESAKCAPPSCVEDNLEASDKVAKSKPEVQRSTPSLSGHWVGEGIQSDGSAWLVTINITGTSGERCAKVDYPEIPCGGYLNCQDASKPDELLAVEVLAYGKDDCVDLGQVEVVLTGANRLLFNWSAEDGLTAKALLQRKLRRWDEPATVIQEKRQ